MASVFVVVSFQPNALATVGIEGRDEVEDPLDEALSDADLGQVTGGGSGIKGTNVDITVEDEDMFDEALVIIRRVLKDLNVPSTTLITRYDPTKIVYSVYE